MISKFVRMRLMILVCMLSLLVSCGGGGGGGTPPGPNPNPLPSLGSGEGSTSSPMDLGIVGAPASHAGSIGAAGQSYYKFTTDSNGGTFKISLTNTHSSLLLYLYANSTFSGSYLYSCDNIWTGGDITCVTSSPSLTPNTSYYVEVSEFGLSSDTYTLTVSQIVSEGTPTSPVQLSVGTGHAGSVNASGSSYYKFQTNSSGEYSVSLTGIQGSASLGIEISSTDFTSPTPIAACTPGYSSTTCKGYGLTANTYYYVQVTQAYASDVLYTITVNPGNSEGSIPNPVALTYGTDHAGAVDGSGNSYYTFTPTNTGDSIINSTSASTLYATVYSGPTFTINQIMQSCNNLKTGQPCVVSGVNSGQPYYLLIGNTLSSSMSYTLNVSAGSDEGSLSQPVPLSLGTAHTASIDVNGVSYYKFNTGANGTASGSGSYTISLNTLLTANWTLYSDSNFSIQVNTTSCSGGTCTTANLDANRNYYLMVRNNSATSGSFNITASTGAGNSEGSVNTPIPLTEGLANAYAGRVAPGTQGYSYYTFTPQNNMVYLIRLASVATGTTTLPWPGVSWDLYSSANFLTTWFGSCNMTTYAGDTVCTTDYYAVPTKLTAAPYYLKVTNGANVANTYTVTITPFDLSLGCNSGGSSSCFNFESGIPITNTFVNGPTDIYTSTPWALVASTVGGGSQSFRSTPPGGKQVAYDSCFKFSASNVKWIGVSSMISSSPTAGTDSLVLFIDGTLYNNSSIDSGNTALNRSIFIPSSGGAHTYEWCYGKSSNATGDYAEVDDIELNY